MEERICREKKTRKITSYYTETEYMKLEKQAQEAGIKVSAFQRRSLLAGGVISYDPKQYAKLCNQTNYIEKKYNNIPGFREDMEALNENVQRTVFGGIMGNGNIESAE